MGKNSVTAVVVIFLVFTASLHAENDYPIVLAHGLGGAERILNIYPYWNGVDDYLRRNGFTVFVPSVTPYNDSYVRGEELAERIREFLLSQGAVCQGDLGSGQVTCSTKAHLIGHSQGGLDARRVAKLGGRGMVRSVLTVATPHQGACLSSELIILNGLGFNFLEWFINLLGQFTYDPSRPGHRPIDARSAAQFFDPYNTSCLFGACYQGRDINTFNADHPTEPGIDYFSVRSATLAPRLLLTVPAWLIGFCGGLSGRGILNDGIVELQSQTWGQTLCYRGDGFQPPCFNCADCSDTLGFDHLSQIGIPITLFNYREFYLTAARLLRSLPPTVGVAKGAHSLPPETENADEFPAEWSNWQYRRQTYELRKQALFADAHLYPLAARRAALRALQRELYGEDAGRIFGRKNYNDYLDHLKLLEPDLDALSPEQRAEAVLDLRTEFFGQDAALRMADFDREKQSAF